MQSLANSMKQFLVSDDGPTAVEYAVMIALIILVCMAAILAVGNNTSAIFDNAASQIS